MADQVRFASFSGDYNPIHVDSLASRRTQAGAPVVHGVHLLLWALDSLAAAYPDLPPLQTLRANFNRFVYLDEQVQMSVTNGILAESPSSRVRLVISVDQLPRAKIAIEFGNADERCLEWAASVLEQVASSSKPLDLGFEELSDRSGRLDFAISVAHATPMFPAASKWLGARCVAAMAATSRLVGMICPGLHSIYSELRIRACGTEDGTENAPAMVARAGAAHANTYSGDSLAFRVIDADPRFRSVQLEIAGGGLVGTIESAARIPPVSQITMRSLIGVIQSAEFAGSVVLIIGGSRGLGELTAKVIAAGGGRVYITWQSGREDARRVAEEIRSAGGLCETLEYDARRPATAQLAKLADSPTHAYYFATPAIFRVQAEIFSPHRLEEFLAIYVDGFWQLANALCGQRSEVRIFYPSSIFVAERPRGMTEYSMAKAAGEVLCADMNEAMRSIRATVKRLPRLLTDQTASTASIAADALDTMIPIIREVQSSNGRKERAGEP